MLFWTSNSNYFTTRLEMHLVLLKSSSFAKLSDALGAMNCTKLEERK